MQTADSWDLFFRRPYIYTCTGDRNETLSCIKSSVRDGKLCSNDQNNRTTCAWKLGIFLQGLYFLRVLWNRLSSWIAVPFVYFVSFSPAPPWASGPSLPVLSTQKPLPLPAPAHRSWIVSKMQVWSYHSPASNLWWFSTACGWRPGSLGWPHGHSWLPSNLCSSRCLLFGFTPQYPMI